MTIESIKAAAEESSKPGTFNFLDRVQSRNYPEVEREIYLDEAAGLKIQHLLNERERIAPDDVEAINRNDSDLALWREKAKESRYTVRMRGISAGDYDEIVDLAQEDYPLEYREDRNPLTFKVEREIIPNEEREALFRSLHWARVIQSVEDANGNVDDNITPELVANMMKGLPLTAQLVIADGVEETRMITAWMDNIQDADFLAKS